ncbi:MAG: PD-(D/E)XK nuclease family protein [Paludibacteraceae bacterium]|nr:PD-(D/E)XK nuclease family protein [Paludibacteraceae bacterium]
MEKFVPFLKTVAIDLVEKNGESKDFSNLTIVFPNKRARLFMNKFLLDVYNERYNECAPLWSPEYATSSNLLEQFAHFYGIPLSIVPDVDRIQLIQLLYKVYLSEAKKKLESIADTDEVPRKVLTKTFDEFYFLGDIILNDFDDIDKNLVDAKMLFRNFKEMKELENIDYLTEEQIKAIQDFLNRDFNTETALFKGFITLWELLGSIYESFKAELEKLGLAYAGMLHRMVAEKLNDKSVGLPEQLQAERQYVFVGFNALNGCETALLKKLNNRVLENGKPSALFYWDYDISYFNPDALNEVAMKNRNSFRDDAGTFLRVNLGGFSAMSPLAKQQGLLLSLPNVLKNGENELNASWQSHDYLQRLSDKQHLKVLSASTDTAQTKYVSKFIRDLKDRGVPDSDIAIVLCDEKLLPAVLHAIPDSVQDMNVTMGFPINQTPAYSLVHLLIQLQVGRGGGRKFSYTDIAGVLRHSVVRQWNSAFAEYLLRELKAQTKTYVSKADVTAFANAFVASGQAISAAHVTKFVDLLFDDSISVKPDADAQPLIKWLLAALGEMASVYAYSAKAGDSDADHNFIGLYEEAYYQVFRMVNCLATSQQVLGQDADLLSVSLFCKLMGKMFASAKVPYSGEPARGMQVMGFLETRSLDFKYVLMLSVDEKHMPKDSFAPSFIPYALRVAYHLPAVEHEDALYAYNFFRLLQRPSAMTLVYNASQNSGGEQSRFLRQLKSEYKAFDAITPIVFNDASAYNGTSLVVKKTDEDILKLKERYCYLPDAERLAHNERVRTQRKGVMNIDLSPSALNSYLDCSLRFYFHYIKQLKVDDDFDSDIDEAFFGRIFHKAMEIIYSEISGHPVAEDNGGHLDAEHEVDWSATVNAAQLKKYVATDELERIVDWAFATEFHVNDPKDYTGIQLIKRDVLVELVRKQVKEDMRYAGEHGFIIYKPEFTISQPVKTALADGSEFTFRLGGVLDRRDMKDNVFRVVDYKTGGDADGHKRRVKNVDAMFEGGSSRSDKVFQATLYSCLWNMDAQADGGRHYNNANREIQPVLMFPRQMNDEYDAHLLLGERRPNVIPIAVNSTDPNNVDVESEFMDRLRSTLREMLNKDVPFKACDDEDTCTFCDFKSICHRDTVKRW